MKENNTKSPTSSKKSKSVTTKTPDLSRPVTMAQEAFYGLAGEVVRLIGPHSEADLAAILLQFLVAFANAIGRTAHGKVGHILQYLVLFIILVGESAKARKGTAWTTVKQLFDEVGGQWLRTRLQGGLASGEGLIYAVRDPRNLSGPNGRPFRDPGATDKRLLVFEPEMAAVFRVARRDGNILSTTLRQAWDGEPLGNLTKNEPSTATGAHISLIGHITVSELVKCLTGSEQSNGLANRFLWCR